MPYITVYQTQHEHQITFEEIIFGVINMPKNISNCQSNTRTYFTPNISYGLTEKTNVERLISSLRGFREKYAALYAADRKSLYYTFYIPKKTGGLREINAPIDSLKEALRELKTLLETEFMALHHTSAFAYVKGRTTIDAVKKHQHNESWWFLKTDFSNFFGNTTPQFLMHMLGMIYPFSEVVKLKDGRIALANALELCFLNGGLPQGTPISPMLTNLMMIPIDHRLYNCLRDYNGQKFVYTRYADDIIISSRRDFNPDSLVDFIRETLHEFKAPFSIKNEKTRYGSRAGQNWNLGVMLNKDNQITIGHKNKKYFRAMLNNYILDRKNGKRWELHDVQVLRGILEYYRTIEKEYVDSVIRHNNTQHSVDVMKMMAADLST